MFSDQVSVTRASFDVRSTIVQQESRWTTSLRVSDDLTKTKESNNTLKLNDLLLHTDI